METETQESEIAVSEYRLELPVDGSEDSEFLKMGMEFGPFERGDKWRGANLPEGWSLKKKPGEKCSYVCDERQRARAAVFTKVAQMRPLQRFRIGRDNHIDDPHENVLFCVWDFNVKCLDKPKVVFEVKHKVPSSKQHRDVHKSRVEIYRKRFEKKARRWLSRRYPNWESYSGHWDEEDEKSNEEANQEKSRQQEDSGADGAAEVSAG
jgi:hypothetical protein